MTSAVRSPLTSFMKWILYLRQKNAVRKNISGKLDMLIRRTADRAKRIL